MEMQYFKQYSPDLGRDMECKVYGHKGRPVIFIPCQDGRCYDFENFHMTDAMAPWIDSGQIMVCSIDTIDQETWSDRFHAPRWRIERYEQWITYITNQVVPFIQNMASEKNDGQKYPGVLVCGCSLGATHATNLFLRRPDLFDRLMALSGIYTAEYGFDNYMDDLVYQNSPIHYMANMPLDHPYIPLLNEKKGVICVGQGPWEIPDSTRTLARILEEKKIHIWVDFWGFDCAHDWDWWYKQTAYFMPYLLAPETES